MLVLTLPRSSSTGSSSSSFTSRMLSTLLPVVPAVARDRSRLPDLLSGKHTRMLSSPSLPLQLDPPLSTMNSLLLTLLAQPQDPLLSTMNSLLLTLLPQPQVPILSTMNSLLSTLLAQPQDPPLLTMNSLLLTLLPQPQDPAQ